MSVKARGYPDMTRRKNDSLPVAAPNELHQWLTSARRHKLVKTREDVEQRTDNAPQVDQLTADRELAAHEPVLPKDFDGNLAEELARQRNVAANPMQEPIKHLRTLFAAADLGAKLCNTVERVSVYASLAFLIASAMPSVR
jgi:hypothetical protein